MMNSVDTSVHHVHNIHDVHYAHVILSIEHARFQPYNSNRA